MPIKWETLITEGDGKISLHRLRKLVTIILAVLGGAVVLLAAAVEALTDLDVPADILLIVVGALVAPITGGQISDGIFGKFQSAKIQEGRAPGRRASDAGNGGTQRVSDDT
jgi:hypothetical protein